MDRKYPAIHVRSMEKAVIDYLKERLDALLKQRGKKAAPFATEVGLKPDVIRDIFRKDAMPSAERLALIADGVEASIDYLLGRADTPSSLKQPAITTDEEILAMLKRIDGLGERGVELAMLTIDTARAANSPKPESPSSDDPPSLATSRHVSLPSRK